MFFGSTTPKKKQLFWSNNPNIGICFSTFQKNPLSLTGNA